MTEKELDFENRSIVMAEIMTPDMSNFHGNVHGGHVLSLLDRVAYACAARYSGKYIVTLSVDQVTFKEPIHVGELLSCYAMINYVGISSIEVGIRVVAENLLTQERRHTNTCYFTMVALDKEGKPTKVKPLTLHDETQKRRFEEAKMRKEARLQLKSHKRPKNI